MCGPKLLSCFSEMPKRAPSFAISQENDRQMCSGGKDKTKRDLLALSTSSSLTCLTLLMGGRSVPQSVPIAPGSRVNWSCYLIVQPATTMVVLNL